MVYTTAVRLTGSDAQAQDIAQEVFVRAYEHFADLKGSASAGGWLKTVATNLSINHLNRYRKRWRFFSELRVTGEDSAPEVEWEVPDTLLCDLSAAQRGAIVDQALRQLPDHQRLPLVLYHFDELSYQEIAAKLGVSLAKVKTDIRRARAALLPLLQAAAARETLES
jgi:RNA polymerase sigma-70 factor (ECF subfamily)